MNIDVDRISLDQRISSLEQKKLSTRGLFDPVDFDQYPDNCARMLPSGFLLKLSIDNMGDFLPRLDGLSIKGCWFSPRIFGFLFRAFLCLQRVVVSKPINANNIFDPNGSIDFIPVYIDGIQAFQEENMGAVPYAFYASYARGGTFLTPFIVKLWSNSTGTTFTQGNLLSIVFSPEGAPLIMSPLFVQGVSGILYPSVSFYRGGANQVFAEDTGKIYESIETILRPVALYSTTKIQKLWAVATPADLEAYAKPFFPTSWSV